MSGLPINEVESEMLKLDNQLCFQLYAASKMMTRAYRPFLEEIGLTYPQYLVMLVLWEGNYNSPDAASAFKTLCYKLDLDSGTLTPLIKRLQQMDLLTKQRGTDDERSILIRLTAKGRELSKTAACIPMKMLEQVNIPVEDLIALRDQLKLFLSDLKT